MKFKHLIFVTITSLFIMNCSSSSGDDLSETPDPNPSTKITYDANIKSIISGNCTSCHGSPTSNGAPTSYTTYTQVKNAVNLIISRINNASNPMPQAGLMPQANRDLIQQWKDDGLLEN